MPELISSWPDEPLLLLAAVFIVSLLESLLIVGLLVPGVALLLSLTLLAIDAQMSPWLWIITGAAGAFAGDALSFEVGRHQQQRIHHWRLFQQHPQWLHQGHDFFNRYGSWSIALGRFIGPLRPIIPAVAGSCGMPVALFYWVNSASALAWAAVYLGLMFWLGEEALVYFNSGQLLLMLVAASILAALVAYGLKRR